LRVLFYLEILHDPIVFLTLTKYWSLLQEQVAQALAASLKGMDPVKGWVRDGQSAPSLTALYDWPQYESDEEVTNDVAWSVSVA
jgi:hypothetical protein